MSSVPALSTAARADSRLGDVELDRVAGDLAGDLLGALDVDVADPHLGALGGEPAADRGADAARSAGHQRLSPLESHAARSIDWPAVAADADSTAPVPIIGGTGALGAGLAHALGARRRAGRDRLPLRRARRGGRRQDPRRASRTPSVEGLENARGRGAAATIVFLTVPFRTQSENLNNLREALRAGPDPRRLHGPPRRRGQRQGDPLARRLAGLGRPAGPGDGPRRRHRRRRPPHRQRPDPRRPRRRAWTRTCSSAATRRPTRRGSPG